MTQDSPASSRDHLDLSLMASPRYPLYNNYKEFLRPWSDNPHIRVVCDSVLSDFVEYQKIVLGFRMAEKHIEVSRAYDEKFKLMEASHRGFGKSARGEGYATSFGVGRPGSLIYYFSVTAEQARDNRLANIKTQITRKRWKGGERLPNAFQALKPNPRIDGGWTRAYIKLLNGTIVRAFGEGTDVRGARVDSEDDFKQDFYDLIIGAQEDADNEYLPDDERPDIVIIDDPVAEKPGTDLQSIKWLLETILQLGHQFTKYILIGTTRRKLDMVSQAVARRILPNFKLYFNPAYDPVTREVSWPAFWGKLWACCLEMGRACYHLRQRRDKEAFEQRIWLHIDAKKLEIKSLPFAREYQLKPHDESSSVLPEALVRTKLRPDLIMPMLPDRYPNIVKLSCTGVDVSAGVSEDSAGNFACVTMAEHRTGYYLCDLEWKHGSEIGEKLMWYTWQTDRMYQHAHRFKDNLSVEANSFQAVFELLLRNKYPHIMTKIYPQILGSEKHTTEGGIPMIRQYVEDLVMPVHIPWGDKDIHTPTQIKYTRERVDKLIDEGSAFIWNEKGQVEFVGAEGHGDVIMGWLHSLRGLEDVKRGSARFKEVEL